MINYNQKYSNAMYMTGSSPIRDFDALSEINQGRDKLRASYTNHIKTFLPKQQSFTSLNTLYRTNESTQNISLAPLIKVGLSGNLRLILAGLINGP